jgi:hypothetical protein
MVDREQQDNPVLPRPWIHQQEIGLYEFGGKYDDITAMTIMNYQSKR